MIPVYNEAQSLTTLTPAVLQLCQKHNWQVIFVNDGSSDRSGEILESLTRTSEIALVVHHKINRGYGGALKSGIRRVRTPYVLTIDADGQHPLDHIEEVLHFALAHDADLVIGRRNPQAVQDSYRAIGKKLIYWFTRFLMPLQIHDLNSGFKLYRTTLAQAFSSLCPNSMAFSDVITLVFLHQRCLVMEYPIQTLPRRSGKSTINTYTALETVIEIFNIILLFNPLRVFLPLSIFFILTGLGWGTGVYLVVGRGMSVAAMLAIVTGLIFIVIGLLANQISSWRMAELEEKIELRRSVDSKSSRNNLSENEK